MIYINEDMFQNYKFRTAQTEKSLSTTDHEGQLNGDYVVDKITDARRMEIVRAIIEVDESMDHLFNVLDNTDIDDSITFELSDKRVRGSDKRELMFTSSIVAAVAFAAAIVDECLYECPKTNRIYLRGCKDLLADNISKALDSLYDTSRYIVDLTWKYDFNVRTEDEIDAFCESIKSGMMSLLDDECAEVTS